MTRSLSEDGIDWKGVALELADHLLHYEPYGALHVAIRHHCDLGDQPQPGVAPGPSLAFQDMDGVDPLPGKNP